MTKAIIAGLLLLGFAAAISIPAFEVKVKQSNAQADESQGRDD